MTRLVISPRADIDVREMLERLGEMAGPAVAVRYAGDLRPIYARLEMLPASGSRRRSLGRYTRIAVLAPYVVIYDYIGDEVVIVRVLDGRRNITRRLVRQ
jgi:plasmid stabilization system protein ParE